jgi:hypothetical protein
MNETPTPQGQSRSETGGTESDEQIASEKTARDIYDGCWTALALDLPCTEQHVLSAITRAHKARAEQSAPAAEQDILGRGWQTFHTFDQRWYDGPIFLGERKPETRLSEGWEWREVVIVPAAPSPAQQKPVEASAQANAIIDACPFPLSDEAEYYLRERIAVHLARALATASLSESPAGDEIVHDDIAACLRSLEDITTEIASRQVVRKLSPVITLLKSSLKTLAAMSSPSVTQTETKSSLPATTPSAQGRSSKETGEAK